MYYSGVQTSIPLVFLCVLPVLRKGPRITEVAVLWGRMAIGNVTTEY